MKQMLQRLVPARFMPLAQALLISLGVSVVLFLMRIIGAESFRFGFLFWNLLLAILPLGVAVLLVRNLAKMGWMAWQNLGLSFVWLALLPNSFYILTDMIHVHLTGEINILFDVVMFFSFTFNGFVFGYISLYLVHRELLKRLSRDRAHLVIAAVLLACSFAVYLGRYLRWNSWDILVHPFGLLFDVTGRVTNPAAHPQFVTTTLIFFLLLTSSYLVIFEFINLLRGQRH